MVNTACIDFVIESRTHNLDDLERVIDIQPYKLNKIGDSTRNGDKFETSYWQYYTETVEINYYLEEIEKIYLNIFGPKIDLLKKYINKYSCSCHITFSVIDRAEEIPAISFTKEFIKIAAELNASIDVDGIYLKP